jgi:hypothetical protein
MGPFFIIVPQILVQIVHTMHDRFVTLDIDLLIFDGAPGPFYKNVINHAGPALDADKNPFCFQAFGEYLAGKRRV